MKIIHVKCFRKKIVTVVTIYIFVYKMLNIISIVLGILIGMLIFLLISWIMYNGRMVFYSGCVETSRICLNEDYYNNPVNVNLTPNSYWVENGIAYYRRQRRENNCIAGADQVVEVIHPLVCQFSNNNVTKVGVRIADGRRYAVDGSLVETTVNCQPVNSIYSTGVPISLNADTIQLLQSNV